MDGARIGLSAEGAFRRSDFAIGNGVPAPGSNLGVGDQVAVTLETEWNSGKPVSR
jgi:polyisoprenoid-binding protein YceI